MEWEPEIEVDETLARNLIFERFPSLDSSSLRRIGAGWDNVVWSTPTDLAFRFPRRQAAVAGVEREIALLPSIAPRLPCAVPQPRYLGTPSQRFPWPWFGAELIPGRELTGTAPDEAQTIALARRLGAFLRSLHDLEPPAVPLLPLDPMGRADMAVRVPKTSAALARVSGAWRAPTDEIEELLARAARLPSSTPADPVLVHGDLHVRHLLVDDDCALAGVIDWGDVCRARPSADLSLYWSLFEGPVRTELLAAYGPVEEDELLRARVLALFLCAILAEYAQARSMPELEREALAGLRRTLLD